nr:MAG TPA: hypothetical protein [Caudoviricetes sp.]
MKYDKRNIMSVDISPVEWYYNIRKRKYKQGGFNYEIR